MDEPRDHHTKRSQTEKDKYHDMTYMCHLRKDKWTYLQKRNRLKDSRKKKTCGYQRGKVGGGINWEFIYVHTTRFKTDNQQGPPV